MECKAYQMLLCNLMAQIGTDHTDQLLACSQRLCCDLEVPLPNGLEQRTGQLREVGLPGLWGTLCHGGPQEKQRLDLQPRVDRALVLQHLRASAAVSGTIHEMQACLDVVYTEI